MKNCLLLFALVCSSHWLSGQRYEASVDLTQVVDDKVKVVCKVPRVRQDSIEFHMPKIVPGTYSIYDFGRFLTDFKALDKKGRELQVDSISMNRWLIHDAKKLSQISYWVEDTYDTRQGNVIFEPAGTNIEEGKNFVINTFGFFGYLEGKKNLPYSAQFKHAEEMFGASALAKRTIDPQTDQFSAGNYFDLADGPIMYCVPDTVTFEIGGAEILISVYSPGKVLSAEYIRSQIEPTLEAQKAYLGDTLPVDNYAYLIYLTNTWTRSGKIGALEHSYSSMYTLKEMSSFYLGQLVRDVSAHEFFHIVTPLNIHSEEIGNFDFINPKMSKHLWLYEGLTEYASGLAQVKYGEMSINTYMRVLLGKIQESKRFSELLPFTVLSENCLDETKSQYYNVYQKGALIGMALDIRLRELSGGSYGVQDMILDLSKEYGKDRSFKDDELFDKITDMTYPEIRSFFSLYVEGSTPIPYGEFFEKVGLTYEKSTKYRELSLGHISWGVNEEDNRLVINYIDAMNVFGKEMGYQEGDIIVQFDGVDIDIENYEEEFQAFKDRHQVGDEITAIVLRKDEKGRLKKKKLSAKAVDIQITTDDDLYIEHDATEEQIALRRAWVNK